MNPVWPTGRKHNRFGLGNVATYVALITFSLVLVFPLLWMISTSLKPIDEIFTVVPRWIPDRPTLDNYQQLISNSSFPRYLSNSIKISLVTTIGTVLIAGFAGYSLSRFRFKGKTFTGTLILVSQMAPSVLLVIPLFVLVRRMGLMDTHLSLMIVYGTFTLPFATWMLKSYFDSIPADVEDAALIDGCTRAQVLFRIVMPLTVPGLIAVALFTFVMAWQDYLFALAFTRSESMRTVTVGLALMQGQQGGVNWGQIMAGSLLACLPALIIFSVLQKYLISGFTQGAVKG